LGNQYDDDRVLRSYLRRALPPDVREQIEPALREMGDLAGGSLFQMQLADRLHEPVLTQWDGWGNRIDHIEITPLWQEAERLAAEFGVVAAAYEGRYGRYDRIHQFALAYLFHPSTDVYTCPLAMTDGAARTLLLSGNRELIDRAVPHLTSRDPARFWTSGQWMTESTGGSDVGLSETVAVLDKEETWRLHGRKWFTSAATGQMTLTLARPEGNPPGGKGLALFYLETRDETGRLQNMEILRLKDKLGTRKVPTAEILLHGAPAMPVVGLSDGVRHIVPMLHLTRTWNAISAVAFMRRGLALARDYARKRVAFGAPLAQKPLHIDTLATLQAEFEAAFHLAFFVVELIGKDEAGEITDEESSLLRLLTSISKLTTGRQAVMVTSEILEAHGGAGYVEDTGLPMLLRDAQVLPIWEGTTNVLSLDALRALQEQRALRDGAPLAALTRKVQQAVQSARDGQLVAAGQKAEQALVKAQSWLETAVSHGQPALEAGARRFALTLGRSLELALLVEQAQWALDNDRDDMARAVRAAACRFAQTPIDLIVDTAVDDLELLVNSEQ
jgi:alkylation response protein AidB-like acyl-CoA dehydrogenase